MTFLSENFLLETDTAAELYHSVARDLPILDYHCHLPPAQMACDHRFRCITEIWLEGDHYKWRAMRACGVDERLITGDATDWEKFDAWARTVPATIMNPLYHWAAMELRKPFGIHELLNAGTAESIFARCNEQLAGGLTAMEILRRFKVAVVCTTDDPADGLEHHAVLSRREKPVTRVYPTWRPDQAFAVGDVAAWNGWVGRLEAAAGASVRNWDEFLTAFEKRHAAFHELGCRASDHGLVKMHAAPFTDGEAGAVFAKLRDGQAIDEGQAELFRSALLHRLALLDSTRGWVQQFHLGAIRDTNKRMRRLLGRDTGYDAMGDIGQVAPLARFLDRLEDSGQLAKTVLYNVNPAWNHAFAAIAGCFHDGVVAGKIQFGAAWWFLDQLDGMEEQMRTLASVGLLSQFIGMTTDSRSFLSFPRHDYFRRLLCQMLGEEVRRGRLPQDMAALGALVQAVCYQNALRYFGFVPGELARGAN